MQIHRRELLHLPVEGRGSRTEDVRLHILYFLFVPLVYSLICYFKVTFTPPEPRAEASPEGFVIRPKRV